ncbi:MAG: oligosaccharide flippase family protein [Ruminococcus sp.]|nr:oligosaccharide flippase family protein [Ruminococcus sp.]
MAEKAKSTQKQMTINIVASIIAFGVTIGINFFLTPHLVSSLGTEAYGFIGLANNFVQYATIVTAALNSMAGRFISVEYHRGNLKRATTIFNSVLIADLFLAAVMLVASGLLTAFIDVILNVPEGLVTSVKITFALTFLTYVISVVTAIFTTAPFVKNRLEINYIRNIISNLIKVAMIVGLFTLFSPQLYFIALASLGSGVFLLLANITVKRRLLPEIKTNFRDFKLSMVKMLITSGMWMSLAQLSNILLSGLDLLICNVTIGATLMGLMSIAKTVPQSIAILINQISSVFTPHYTILYAKNDMDGLVKEVNFTSKIQSLIMTVPLAGFIVFGHEFYTLWQPSKTPDEITTIQIISVLTVLMYLFTAHTQALTMLNSVFNKLKTPVLVALGVGVFSTIAVLLIVNFTDLSPVYKAFFIAGISSLLMSLRSLIFVPLYSAYLLKQKKTIFYPAILRSWLSFLIIAVIFFVIRSFIPMNSWGKFLIVCVVAGLLGYVISLFTMFNRKELALLKSKITGKLKKNNTNT